MTLVNIGILFWLLFIILYVFNGNKAAWYAYIAIVLFITHIIKDAGGTMFIKSKAPAIKPGKSDARHEPDNKVPENKVQQSVDTVISAGVKVEGEIFSSGTAYIYGEVKGNVHAAEGTVKVREKGSVNGNITCRKLIVNGTVTGDCRAEEVEIMSQGKIQGVLNYNSLNVIKGGQLSGSVEILPDSIIKKHNIIELSAENAEARNDTAATSISERKTIKQSKV